MRISDEELDMLGVRYTSSTKLQAEFSTFAEYVLNYINDKKGLMK